MERCRRLAGGVALLILLCATPASAGDVWRIAERIDDLALDITEIRDLRSPDARASRIRHAATRLDHLSRRNSRLRGWNATVNSQRIDRLHHRLARLERRTEYGPVQAKHKPRRTPVPRLHHPQPRPEWTQSPRWHDPRLGIFIGHNGLAILID